MRCSKCGLEIPRDSDTCTRCGTPILRKNDTPTRRIQKDFSLNTAIYFSPGDSFGERYKVVEEIGSGGMGKIFKAFDNELGIHVAIKMIRPEILSKPDTLARFRKEILIAREITHENVVRIYDFGEVDGVKFISMQYIDGENLADLIRTSGTLSSETAISIAKQICRGIDAAHKKDIIHRDLKPQNIMIDKNGKVYITDFGLAKSLQETGLSTSGVVMGTPQYLSPEQAKGDNVDQRSDIYTLGIIMYEMITGQELFVSETVIGFLQKHISQKPTNPSEINESIPPFFEKIILKCLEKEKSKRYQDAEKLLKDLQNEKVTSGPIFISHRYRKIVKRSFIPFLIVIAVAALIYFLIISPEPPSPPGDTKNVKDDRKLLVVLRPGIISSDQESEHLDESIQSLLITDLWQSSRLQPASENKINEILDEFDLKGENRINEDIFPKIASRISADAIVWGKYTKTDTNSRFDLIIWEKGRERPNRYPIMGSPGGDVFTLVDNITRKIKENFFPEEPLSSDIDEDVGRITTTSAEAYREYIIGKNHYWNSNYQESNEALQKAIALDPKFAMAYYTLAVNCIDQGHNKKAREYLQKAIEFMGRVSARERYLIRIKEYSILKYSTNMAIETCKEMLKQYPDDDEGKMSLGVFYRNSEQWGQAEQIFENILERDNQSWSAISNLYYIYMVEGRFDKAGELLQKNLAAPKNRVIYHRYLARVFLYKHDFKSAFEELKKAQDFSTNSLNISTIELLGQFYHIKENFNEAEKYYRQLIRIDDKNAQATGHLSMSSLYLLQGKYALCRDEVNKGIEHCRENGLEGDEASLLLFSTYLDLQTGNPARALKTAIQIGNTEIDIGSIGSEYIKELALHLEGYCYLQQNIIIKAKDAAARLEKLILKSGISPHKRVSYHLRGLICIAEEKFPQAIQYFEQALPILPHFVNDWDNRAFYFEPLAAAYFKTDNIEKAREYYEKIQPLTICRLQWGDIYTRSFYMLGEIYRAKGDKKEAVKQYKRFLQLWKDADPDLPLLISARKRLAELGEEPFLTL